jgi:hypothetical protein
MVRVLAMVTIFGCGGRASAPPPVKPSQHASPSTGGTVTITAIELPLDRDLPRLAMRITAMYVAVADAVTTAGTDCKRVVDGVTAARERHRDAIAATTIVIGDGRAADLEAALDPHSMTIAGALRRMSPRLDTCRDDAALGDALDQLGG